MSIRCTHALAAAGATGPVLFVLTYLVNGAVQPDYDSSHDTISTLSLGRHGWIQIANFVVYGEIDLSAGIDWRTTLREMALAVRALILRHPWLTRLSAPQMVYELTPHRMALTELALAALHDDLGLDLDTAMAACRTVSMYVQGATSAEIGLRDLMDDRGWTTGADARAGLATHLRWLLDTGRYPTFQRYAQAADRKDDLRWQFETGLDQVLDGIGCAAH